MSSIVSRGLGIRLFLPALVGLLVIAFAPAALAAPMCLGQPATITGTNGDNTIPGTNGNDVIVAKGGDDTINAKGGDDFICSGGGHDTVNGGPGDDLINGGPTHFDLLTGGPGNDLIDGGGGGDDHAMYQNAASPIRANLARGLVVGQGRDHLQRIESVAGGLGDDVLLGNNLAEGNSFWGGPGEDTMRGRGGFDFFTPGLGDDTIVGGAGFDILDPFFAINFVDGGGAPPVNVNFPTGTSTGQGTDSFRGIEEAGGTDGADNFLGDGADNTLTGFGGNDVFMAGAGNDTIHPGAGDDQVDGGTNNPVGFTSPEDAGDIVDYGFQHPFNPVSSAVTVDLTAGTVTGAGTDALAGIETALGTPLNDTLMGDNNRNGLAGFEGSDNLDGLGADDLLDGDDVIFGQNFSGTDDLDGGAGTADVCLGGETTANCESTTPPFPPPPGPGYLLRAGMRFGVV